MAKTLYEILGLEVNATSKEVTDAYYRLALSGEDQNSEDLSKDRSRELLHAYETLLDVKKRSDYDKTISVVTKGEKLETTSTSDSDVEEYIISEGDSSSESSEYYYYSNQPQDASNNEQTRNVAPSNPPKSTHSKTPMEVIAKYYEFLQHSNKFFLLVAEKLTDNSIDNKLKRNLEEKIGLFDSIMKKLDKLQKHGRDQKKYNEKYIEMKQNLETEMASAWHQIYEITESSPDENKLNPNYMPTSQDFKKIADTTLKDWKDSIFKKMNDNVMDSIQNTQNKPVTTSLYLHSKQSKITKKATIENSYEHKAESQDKGRYHAFEVSGEDFFRQNGKSIAEKYRQDKGDFLKTKILNDFKKIIESTDTEGECKKAIDDFKKTVEYEVLKTGQGTLTKIFNLETSSEKALNKMIQDKYKQIEDRKTEEKQNRQEI